MPDSCAKTKKTATYGHTRLAGQAFFYSPVGVNGKKQIFINGACSVGLDTGHAYLNLTNQA